MPAASSARRSTTSITGGAPLGRLGRMTRRHVPARTRPTRVDGRRGAAQDDRRPGQLGQPDRAVAGLQSGRPIALVGPFVLLVDDDQAQLREWRQDRQPRPDQDVDRAGPNPPPLVGPFAFAEARMEEPDPGIEIGPQAVHDRQGQGDLGNEQQDRPAKLEGGRDRLDVDGRLAAAGHAVEEEWRGIAPLDRRPDQADGLDLGRGEGRRGGA